MVRGVRSGAGNAEEGGEEGLLLINGLCILNSFAAIRARLGFHTISSHILSKKSRFLMDVSKPASGCSFWWGELGSWEKESHPLVKKSLTQPQWLICCPASRAPLTDHSQVSRSTQETLQVAESKSAHFFKKLVMKSTVGKLNWCLMIKNFSTTYWNHSQDRKHTHLINGTYIQGIYSKLYNVLGA